MRVMSSSRLQYVVVAFSGHAQLLFRVGNHSPKEVYETKTSGSNLYAKIKQDLKGHFHHIMI